MEKICIKHYRCIYSPNGRFLVQGTGVPPLSAAESKVYSTVLKKNETTTMFFLEIPSVVGFYFSLLEHGMDLNLNSYVHLTLKLNEELHTYYLH